MGILDMWREARGDVMRQQYEDVMRRIRVATPHAQYAFFNNVEQTIESLKEAYGAASKRERKALLEECRKSANQMWDSGDWPSSLGLVISCLNVESEYVPGKDAAYVKAETEKVIKEAAEFFAKRAT